MRKFSYSNTSRTKIDNFGYTEYIPFNPVLKILRIEIPARIKVAAKRVILFTVLDL